MITFYYTCQQQKAALQKERPKVYALNRNPRALSLFHDLHFVFVHSHSRITALESSSVIVLLTAATAPHSGHLIELCEIGFTGCGCRPGCTGFALLSITP
jgi:hypothetical protein